MGDATASDDVAFDDLPPRGMRPVKTPEEIQHDAGHPGRDDITESPYEPCCPYGVRPPVIAPDADLPDGWMGDGHPGKIRFAPDYDAAMTAEETPDVSVPPCRVRTLTLPKVHMGQGILTSGSEMSPGFILVVDRVGESASDPRVIEVWHGLAGAAGARTFILCPGEIELADPWIEKLIELSRTPRKR